MLKLTWEKIQSNDFMQAMVSLNGNPKLDTTTAYRVGRICRTCQSEMQKAAKAGAELLKKYVTPESAAKPEEAPVYNSPTAQAEYEAEYSKLLKETTVEIKVHPLSIDKLQGLSGYHLMAVEEICADIPEVA